MKIYRADSEVIRSELIRLREKLVVAKNPAERHLCLSDMELFNCLYYSLMQDEFININKILKKSKSVLESSDKFYHKLSKNYNESFITNKAFINYLSSRSLNVYAKELDKYIEPDIIEEAIFTEDDANILLHDFFRKYHPESIEFIDDLILNKRILRVDELEQYGGLCFYIYKALPFLIVQSPKYSISTLQSLIHELGHAINFNKISNDFSINKIEKYLSGSPYIEVISRLYEKEALEFFIDENVNRDYALTLLADYHYSNYYFLLETYVFSLLPDHLLEKNNYYIYSNEELKLFIEFDQYNVDIDDAFNGDKLNLFNSFNYGISGLVATILSSKIKDNKDNSLYYKFLPYMMDSFRPSIFDELGIDYKEASKCIKKELNYLLK